MLYVWSKVTALPVGEILLGILVLKIFTALSTVSPVTSYTPVEEFILLVNPLVSCPATSENVQLVVLSVVPTKTLNVPPASSRAPLARLPSVFAETVCALFVKNAVILSEPDLTPKIVTVSVANGLPLGVPSNNCTVTTVTCSAAGSSASSNVKVLIVPDCFVEPPTINLKF